jgi:formyltetrahydrofolate-dependent phosphoribosylglycinamide formyltransferase
MSTQPELARLVVLVSGSVSNLQAVLDACASECLPAQVVAVISNRSDAYALQRAQNCGIPTVAKTKPKTQDRQEYDAQLAAVASSYNPDWVLLAGWMRLLSPAFLDHFPNQVVNLHPALPGMFPGTHAIQRAYEAFQAGQIQHTGVMVHLVPDAGVDCGPVLAQEIVPIFPGESIEKLEERMHHVEHRLLVDTLRQVVKRT